MEMVGSGGGDWLIAVVVLVDCSGCVILNLVIGAQSDRESHRGRVLEQERQCPGPKLKVAGEVIGPLLAVFLAIASYWIYRSIKLKKETELKIEQFLVDYKALKLTRYSQWYPVERPSMKVVIQMLESEETASMPRNPFTSTNGTQNATNARGRIFSSELEIISESE
ncbi:unnamed protein product [Fraxinus pennsylvanica]|uniref:Uncharacterized protein n=1 Tax=Fraxinus pennsylvanica TaxID=56036 RepID=A0AAD2DWT8_9LAMI|nr:unnamed protein product [Fraxinus pennsylvanica]